MNYLAHVFFSFHNEELLVGNILADLLHGREIKLLHDKYSNGIRLHRAIDFVTDNNHLHSQSLKVLYPTQGKYAPVVMDIFYDYFLSKHWSLYSETDMRVVCDDVYDTLLRHSDQIPDSKKEMIQRMVADDFLYSCSNIPRLSSTFERLKRRVTFTSNLSGAVQDLQTHEVILETHFLKFFPTVIPEIIARHNER